MGGKFRAPHHREALGLEVHIGVGVHTGSVFVGNMGTTDFINYTVVGDSVNLASRLEGLCPQYGVGIVISGETKDACGDAFAFQYLDVIRVKGKTQPVTVYQPLRQEEANERQAELAAWAQALESYLAGDFATADTGLTDLCANFPETKLYAVYADRTFRLLKNPPSFWNGIWTGTQKL